MKLILLYQLKKILDELLRIFHGRYQLMQLYIRASFSSPVQAPFFLICTGNSTGAGFRPHVMPRHDVTSWVNRGEFILKQRIFLYFEELYRKFLLFLCSYHDMHSRYLLFFMKRKCQVVSSSGIYNKNGNFNESIK